MSTPLSVSRRGNQPPLCPRPIDHLELKWLEGEMPLGDLGTGIFQWNHYAWSEQTGTGLSQTVSA